MVCSLTRLMTVTGRVWCLRQARAIRCSRRAGFQGWSMLTTVSATWRLSPHAAGFGGEEQPAFGIGAKPPDLGPALRLRDAARVPGELDTGGDRVLAHQLQHPHPLGEHDDLPPRVLQEIGQQPLDLLHLGTVPVLVAEDPGRVADHAHAGEEFLEPLELLLRERPSRCQRGEALHVEVVVLVGPGLRIGHRHEEGLDGPAGKLAFDVFLAPPEHHRGDPPRELVQVPEAGGLALLVQLVELPVEAKQRSQEIGVQELDDRVDLVDAVLERRAGQHEGVPALEPLHRVRGLGVPVLDALGLVEDHDVGPKRIEKVLSIRHDLLVVTQREEGAAPVGRAPRRPGAGHDGRREVGELGDLLLPLGLERRGRDHEDPLDPAQLAKKRAGGNGLDRLSQTHVVGKEHALSEREMEHSLDLVRQERMLERPERSAARLKCCLEAGTFAPPAGGRPSGVDPRLQRAGEPKALGVGACHGAERIERLPRSPAQTAPVPYGLLNEFGVHALDRLGNRHPHRPVVGFVDKDLDATARSRPFRFPASRWGGSTAAQAMQDALDVLAGSPGGWCDDPGIRTS